MTESAIDRDAQWLKDRSHHKLIDSERFSDWVTRCMGDGLSEAEAREKVIKLVEAGRE